MTSKGFQGSTRTFSNARAWGRRRGAVAGGVPSNGKRRPGWHGTGHAPHSRGKNSRGKTPWVEKFGDRHFVRWNFTLQNKNLLGSNLRMYRFSRRELGVGAARCGQGGRGISYKVKSHVKGNHLYGEIR